MSRTDDALCDLRTLMHKATLKGLLAMAKTYGVDAKAIAHCKRTKDTGSLAHLIIRKGYGERTYYAARRRLFAGKAV